MIILNGLGVPEYLAAFLLAFPEWLCVLLYVYCLKRVRQNFFVKLSAAILAILSIVGVAIAQRHLYYSTGSRRPPVSLIDVVVVAAHAVALFVLFYGLRRLWNNSAANGASQGSDR
jgi:hypothetical protein